MALNQYSNRLFPSKVHLGLKQSCIVVVVGNDAVEAED